MRRHWLLVVTAFALSTIIVGRGQAQSDTLRWYQSSHGFEYLYPADWSPAAPAGAGVEGSFRSSAADASTSSLTFVVDAPVDPTSYLIDQIAADRNVHPDLEALGAVATDITGADTAAVTAESYTSDGTAWGMFKMAALRGNMLVIFVIETSQAYEEAHATLLQQMVGSFRFQTAFDSPTSSVPQPTSTHRLLSAGGQGDQTTATFENDGEPVQVCWGADGVSPATGVGPSASFSIRRADNTGTAARFMQNTFGRHCADAGIGTGTFVVEVSATPWTAWTVSVSGG